MANKDFYYLQEDAEGNKEYKKVNLGTEGQLLSVTAEGDIGLVDEPVYRLQANNSIYPVNGNNNMNSASNAGTISGGVSNCILTTGGTVGGGSSNRSGCYGVVGGGICNKACGAYNVIAGGHCNCTLNTNCHCCKYMTVGGGSFNRVCNNGSTIGGGQLNTAIGQNSVISGGYQNCITNSNSTIGGGTLNTVAGQNSVISGGNENCIVNSYSFIGSGYRNEVFAAYSAIGSGQNNRVNNLCSFIGSGSSNCVCGRASGVVSGGNNELSCDATYSVIGSGLRNCITHNYAFVGSGLYNQNDASASSIVGGGCNRICSNSSVSIIAGGGGNIIEGKPLYYSFYASIIGGQCNKVEASYGTIGGGILNCVSGEGASVLGGRDNVAKGFYSTIVGGAYACTDLFGEKAYSSVFFDKVGDAQTREFVLRGTTSDGKLTLGDEMFAGNGWGIQIKEGASWVYEVYVVGRNDENGVSLGFKFEGVIENALLGSIVLNNNKTIIWDDDSTDDCDLTIIEDFSGIEYLNFNLTGSENTRWVANVKLVQIVGNISYGSCCCCV